MDRIPLKALMKGRKPINIGKSKAYVLEKPYIVYGPLLNGGAGEIICGVGEAIAVAKSENGELAMLHLPVDQLEAALEKEGSTKES
jgi:hypothetical protein